MLKSPQKKLARTFADKSPSRKLRRIVATLTPLREETRKFRFGRLQAGPLTIRCALGAGGVSRAKREGDRSSPAGNWRLLCLFYRPDRAARWGARLPARPLRPGMGWCDDPESAAYNRLIAAPSRASHETLWREDRLYDLVIVLDYNVHPRRKRAGSAIFLHCRRPGFAPTEGCVALDPDDLRRLLPRLSRETTLVIR